MAGQRVTQQADATSGQSLPTRDGFELERRGNVLALFNCFTWSMVEGKLACLADGAIQLALINQQAPREANSLIRISSKRSGPIAPDLSRQLRLPRAA
jgi:hypothetical protein